MVDCHRTFVDTQRCGVREGEHKRHCWRLAQVIKTYDTEWASLKPDKESEMKVREWKRWQPPPENVVKINCDGAFSSATKSGGWGFLIREWDGGVISSGYGKLEYVGEALYAETVACLQALQRAADLGIQRIMVETDASL